MDSLVPRELADYHAHLQQAFAQQYTNPYQALNTLWQAFEAYVEPLGLELALALSSPYPALQQRLHNWAHLLYPAAFPAPAVKSSTPTPAHSVSAYPAELQNWVHFCFPAQRPRVSVCMIVRNEERFLAAALRSVEELADEIVVVDTGSTDRTPEIARGFAKVRFSEWPWQDDFAAARNVSLERATGDWALILDADEELLPSGRQRLQQFFSYPPLGWQAFALREEHELADHVAYSWASHLLRRQPDVLRYYGALHENPVKYSPPHWLLGVILDVGVRHRGNLPEVQQQQQKGQRIGLLQKMLQSNQQPNPYYLYHYAYAQMYGFGMPQDLQAAENLFLQALEATLQYRNQLPPFAEWQPAPIAALVLKLARLYFRQARWADVLGLYQRFAADCPQRDLLKMAARSAEQTDQLELAVQLWLQCFQPYLQAVRAHEPWQWEALLALLDLGLRQHDGFLALFAVRRLLEQQPAMQYPSPQALENLQQQLEKNLKLPEGSWLDRLDFEIQQALSHSDIRAVARYAWMYLAESWDQTVLSDALQALKFLGADSLLASLSQMGRVVYPHQKMFQLYQQQGQADRLSPQEQQLPGAGYWLELLTPAPQRPKVSVCMIVRNAEAQLSAALRSVEALADEYVIADTGSWDQTPEVIRQWSLTHQVISFDWRWDHDFAAARNATLARATGDWILVLDADEVLQPESVAPLKQLLAYRPRGWQVFAFECLSIYDHPQRNSRDWVARLFARHPQICYWGKVHERLGHRFRRERLPVQPLRHIRLHHTGYLQSEISRHRKAERIQQLAENLKIADIWNPYFLYHYGYALIYQMSPPQLQKGLHLLKLSLQETQTYQQRPPLPGWFPAPVRKVQLILFRVWYQQGQHETLQTYYPHWQANMQEPEFHYWYAQSALARQDYVQAQRAFERCLQATYPQQPAAGFDSWLPLQGLISISLATGNWQLGIQAFQELYSLPQSDSSQQFAKWWQAMLQTEKTASKRGASCS